MTDGDWMSPEPAFVQAQREFARYLRDPDTHAIPLNLPEPHIAVYRDAVLYNIERFMADNFPRVKAVFDPPRWHAMVRDYLVRHRADTPVFARLPGEFLAYLEHERNDTDDPPYLYELAHFDWLENALGTDPRRIDLTGIDPNGDLLDAPQVVNPIHIVVSYRFPVHGIDANYQPVEAPAQATHLIAFRDSHHHYGILDLNPVALRLFVLVRDHPEYPARGLLEQIARELGRDDAAPVIAGGRQILQRMRERGVILGSRT
jgi:hypothetical protein